MDSGAAGVRVRNEIFEKGKASSGGGLSGNADTYASEIAAFRKIRDSWYIRWIKDAIMFPS